MLSGDGTDGRILLCTYKAPRVKISYHVVRGASVARNKPEKRIYSVATIYRSKRVSIYNIFIHMTVTTLL